ncbi:MAG: hypothetical protein ACFFDN_41870 [Candidatus Hodarchaeota archaeon]
MKKGTVFLLLTLTLVFGFNSTKLLRAQVDEKDQKILELQKEIKTFKSELEKLIQENKSINELKERIDLLETKLEKLKIEMQEINPLITDVTKNWGKGFYLGSRIDNYPTTYSAEVGYNFNLQKKKMPWINRLGLVIGFMANQQKIEKEKKSIYIFPFHAFYTKLTLSTPIYINFIGLSLSQKFIYDYSSGDKWYLGGGIDINFWIHRRTCITLGFFGEPRIFQNDNNDAQSDDILGKTQLGIKWFFK